MVRVAPHLEAERFKREESRLLIETGLAYWTRTQRVPTSLVVLQEINRSVEAGKTQASKLGDCARLLEDAEDLPPVDSAYILELVLSGARKRAVFKALDEGLKLYTQGRFDDIRDSIVKAVQIGAFDTSPGIQHESSLQQRTDDRRANKQPPRLGTGIGDLDDSIRGGLAAGELGVILGAPKFGKSMMLSNIAYHALGLGRRVVYYSLEMGERDLTDRLDACIANVVIDELPKKADYVHEYVDDWYQVHKGQLVIKQFPSYETKTRDLDGHLQLLRSEMSFEPDLIIIDSGDLMGSSRDTESRYEELGSVYSELRGLAVKLSIPAWTASWAKRESLSKKTITMGDIAESFKKVAIADVGIAICGTEDERQDRLARLYVAFCRFAAGGHEVGPFKTGFARGRMYDGDADIEDEP